MGESNCDYTYVLVVKDDISRYVALERTDAANAENVAISMARCFRVFGVPQFWLSDQGLHFINLIMEYMARTYAIKHEPTGIYSPWCNSTVEAVMRHVLVVAQAMSGELWMAPKDWPCIIWATQLTMNNDALQRLGKSDASQDQSPFDVMRGAKPEREVPSILPRDVNLLKPTTTTKEHTV